MALVTDIHTDTPSQATGYAGAVVTVLIWAAWMLATRQSAATSLNSIDIGLIRFGIPALVLAPVWWRTGLLPRGVPLRILLPMVAGSGIVFLHVAATALQVTPAGPAAILLGGAMPLATALIGILLFGERPDRMRLLGLSGIVAGVAILLAGSLTGSGMTLGGLVLLPLGALLWAGFTHAFRRSGLSALQGAAIIAAWSFLLNLPLVAVFGQHVTQASLAELLPQVLSQGILSGLVATLAYGTAIRALGGSQAAAFTALTPVLATLGSGYLLGEPVGLTALLAALVTGAGVALSTGILSKA
ncbi:DMT family transporter [Rhizobium sp. YJ-22]|uniref:DMT family transporter n=1 Tax=Rhizobium sp. YJ-22 TaxID=3037556 RepID=UPI0024121A13|nr:DMT family transporter [Rhizobium sp. YJ-22]MDG3574813.1 DMT family transporter [Rhizobium sp. YJ-22]